MTAVKVTIKQTKPAKKLASMYSTRASVQKAMLEKLSQSLLSAKDAALLKMMPHTADDVNGGGYLLPVLAAGFIIPYFDLDGAPTKFWRYRYLETTKRGFAALTTKKEMRYAQAAKTLNEVYLPPFVKWSALAADHTTALVITEGELKAACATKYTFPTIGLGGVWNFEAKKQDVHLLPMLKRFKWQDRAVYICYDSDASTNPMVLSAESALARKLTDLGARPHLVRLPTLPGQTKTGLDDFLMDQGPAMFKGLLEDATPYAEAAELHALNEEVVYDQDSGAVVKLTTLKRMSPRAFWEHAYADRVYLQTTTDSTGMKTVEKCAPKEWIKWRGRGTVPTVTYAPGEDRITVHGALNTWTGWGCSPKPGPITPWAKLLDFLFSAEPGLRMWFEKWLAYQLQNPGVKLFTSVVIHGRKQGTGKTLVGYTVKKIFGHNFGEIGDHDLQSGDNDWAECKQFILGDEITGGDKRKVADRMKSMITQNTIRINIKFIPKYTLPDCINYLFTSNHPDAFFLEDDDRRFAINEVVGDPLPTAFYADYEKWMEGDGPAHLFHHLLSLDVSDFNPRGHAPASNAKTAMIEHGRSDLGHWCHTLRTNPDAVLRMDSVVLSQDLWAPRNLLDVYERQTNGGRGVTLGGLGKGLATAGLRHIGKHGIRCGLGQPHIYALRNASKYAKMLDAQIGAAYDKEWGYTKATPMKIQTRRK